MFSVYILAYYMKLDALHQLATCIAKQQFLLDRTLGLGKRQGQALGLEKGPAQTCARFQSQTKEMGGATY